MIKPKLNKGGYRAIDTDILWLALVYKLLSKNVAKGFITPTYGVCFNKFDEWDYVRNKILNYQQAFNVEITYKHQHRTLISDFAVIRAYSISAGVHNIRGCRLADFYDATYNLPHNTLQDLKCVVLPSIMNKGKWIKCLDKRDPMMSASN
jgi:hypothetical protein